MINDQQCNHLARKHGLESSDKLRAALKEAFRLGRDSDVMKVAHRKKEEHTTVASSDKA